jgi:hypothetical protein
MNSKDAKFVTFKSLVCDKKSSELNEKKIYGDSCYENYGENEFDNFDETKPITLRRSQSTTQVDMLNSKLQKRREITSAIMLAEEKEKQIPLSNEASNEKTSNSQVSNEANDANSQIVIDSSSNNSNNNSNLQRCHSRSSNRLSGLKKLESLYKAFKDDDDDFFSNQKTNRNCKLKFYS